MVLLNLLHRSNTLISIKFNFLQVDVMISDQLTYLVDLSHDGCHEFVQVLDIHVVKLETISNGSQFGPLTKNNERWIQFFLHLRTINDTSHSQIEMVLNRHLLFLDFEDLLLRSASPSSG